MLDVSTITIGIGIAVGVAALGVGIGQGLAANAGLTGMARQPESAGRIQTGMMIALAFIELVFLLTFVVALMLVGKVPNYEEARQNKELVVSSTTENTQNLRHH